MKKLSRIISLVIITAIISSFLPVCANNNISVFVNNSRISFDVEPVIINNRTMVPLRAIFEKIGAEVEWNETTKTAEATCQDTLVSVKIDDEVMYVNGVAKKIDAPAKIVEQRTLIPLRAVCEAFDCTVDWDETLKKVSIDAKGVNRRNGGLSALKVEKSFDERIALLYENILNSEKIRNIYKPEEALNKENPYTVFISVCDAKSRAIVFHNSAFSIEEAFNKAFQSAKKFVFENNYNVIWIKADVVDSFEKLTTDELKVKVTNSFNEFYRKGISLDDNFNTAFLEAEINGNKMLDYKETKEIDLDVINTYIKKYQKHTPKVNKIPDQIIAFTCIGFMCDENSKIYELNGYGDNKGLDYGRRSYKVDRDAIKDVVLSGTYWLANEIQDDGLFNYGYYPTYDKLFTAYNYLRHLSGMFPLMWTYTITGDEKLKESAKITLERFLKQIVNKSENVSYLLDRTEIKLGGNGVAIVLLDTYMQTFGKDEKLIALCERLGEGMLELQNKDGSYYHILNPDFTKKEEYRTVYYDGEATYGFCVLYKLTGNKKWLNAAQKAMEYFIENDYTQYRDHWVAYAVNEITKHIDDERYYEFGLKNLQLNMKRIYNQKTSYHTYMELLLAGFEMYDRMIEEKIECDYLEEFDEEFFAQTIQRRAEHMLNGFFYPEYAMYLKNPESIVGTFHVRHDGYRVRIDDVDHFIAGYFHYWQLYDKVQKYLK
ncbi:MAG: glycosyl hydrolase family 88 [Ruminococcaceae bacterium]|nr:glycosyl hydrolase family 88 [Oscillospiraceae bacterium]